MPVSELDKPNEPLAISAKSPMKLRRVVERFAIYFRREFEYDFQQFEATEKPKAENSYAAYLFANEPNWDPRVWVGACCFRWRKFEDVGHQWAMQWMWLHPYFRGKGILSHSWDKFHELHGNFFCEPPFSRAMTLFLRKQAKCILCWQPLDAVDGTICTRCEARHIKNKTNPRVSIG